MTTTMKLAAVFLVAAGAAAAWVVLSRSDAPETATTRPAPDRGAAPNRSVAAVPEDPGRKSAPPPADVPPEPRPQTQNAPAPVPEPTPDAPDTPPAEPRRPVVAAAGASVFGRVVLDGEPPPMGTVDMSAVALCAEAHTDPVREETVVVGEGNALANVVVSVKPPEGGELKGDAPKEPVVLDQVGCRYVPHVVAVMVGQPFLVANSDPFLHNVHSLAINNEGSNFAQPRAEKPGRKLTDKIKVPERFSIKCDVHPWMLAHVSAFEHPYFAVTDMAGAFSIPAGLEDGTYTLIFWHEKFGEQEVEGVEVKGGKAGKPVEFTFKQEAAAAPRGSGERAAVAGATRELCAHCATPAVR